MTFVTNYCHSEIFMSDMILFYGECRKNSVLADQMYTQRFPERRHPSRHYFKKLEKKIRRESRVQNQEFIVN